MNFQDQFNAKQTNILFLDTSSSCTGYSIATCSWEERKAVIHTAGALWLDPKWEHQQKYHYMQKSLETYFYIVEKIDYVVHEMYSVNPKRMTGVMVVPELIGSIKSACQEIGIKADSILPQTWRKHLGVKKDKENNDWKRPVQDQILTMIDVPERCVSNITGKERNTPDDVFDALGIAYGFLMKLEGADGPFFREVKFEALNINPHLGYDLKGEM